jgi:aspartyl-tRNA(Asn)/glutamyl-tRNA(Gln) amidotransferase subunit C
MTASFGGQFKDIVHRLYTARKAYIRGTNRFDSPVPVRLVSRKEEREGRLKLTDNEFTDLEALARIDLVPEERERLRLQLDRVIGFVRKLQEIETGEASTAGTSGRALSPRPDEQDECLDREEVLGQAPDREEGFFRVPRVIDRRAGEGS